MTVHPYAQVLSLRSHRLKPLRSAALLFGFQRSRIIAKDCLFHTGYYRRGDLADWGDVLALHRGHCTGELHLLVMPDAASKLEPGEEVRVTGSTSA